LNKVGFTGTVFPERAVLYSVIPNLSNGKYLTILLKTLKFEENQEEIPKNVGLFTLFY
jgi:hypothetical protein